MTIQRRQTIYRVHHDTGLALRQIVRECRGLQPADIGRRYGVILRPARSAR